MKLTYEQLRLLVRSGLPNIQEADKKDEKANAQNYKEKFEQFGNTFICPRHAELLKTKWIMTAKLNKPNVSPEAKEKLKKTGNIIPPTSSKEFPNELLVQANKFGYVPQEFYCPLSQVAAEMTQDDLTTIARGDLPDAYTVISYDEYEDPETGEKVLDPKTNKPKKKAVEKSMRCDYKVTPRWAKPGQVSSYYARGEVAEEEEERGRLRRDEPKRSKQWNEKISSMVTVEGAPKALVDKIRDMEKRGYSYRWVPLTDAADAVYKFIKTHGVRGIDAIALGEENGKQHIEIVTTEPRYARGIPNTVGGFPVRVVDAPTKQKRTEKQRNIKSDILNPDFIKVDGQVLWDKDQAKVDTSNEKLRAQRAWTKVPMRKTADGRPIFTSNDVHYLSGPFAKGLRDAKAAGGSTYVGPEPYYGMKRDKVEQLLINMGWEMADSEAYGDAEPQTYKDSSGAVKWTDEKTPADVKRTHSLTGAEDFDDEEDDSDLGPDAASVSKKDIEDYARWISKNYSDADPGPDKKRASDLKKRQQDIDDLIDKVKDEE